MVTVLGYSCNSTETSYVHPPPHPATCFVCVCFFKCSQNLKRWWSCICIALNYITGASLFFRFAINLHWYYDYMYQLYLSSFFIQRAIHPNTLSVCIIIIGSAKPFFYNRLFELARSHASLCPDERPSCLVIQMSVTETITLINVCFFSETVYVRSFKLCTMLCAPNPICVHNDYLFSGTILLQMLI